MFNIPSRRHHYATLPSRYSKHPASSIPRYYSTRERQAILESEQGGEGLSKFLKTLVQKPMDVANKAISGSLATKLKSMVNKRAGFPNSFKGEKHPISLAYSKKLKKPVYGFNSYLGPNTNVAERLRRGIKPLPGPRGQRDSMDRAGYAHDLRFATARNIGDLRRADKKFVSKLKQLSKRQKGFNPSFQIGMRGIQTKMRLEDKGLLSKSKFLNPFKKGDPIDLAKKELKKLEQEGYGEVPGAALRQKIMRQIGKKKRQDYGRERISAKGGFSRITDTKYKRKPKRPKMKIAIPKKIKMIKKLFPRLYAKVIATKMIPHIIRKIHKRTGVKPRMMGSGMKNNMAKMILTKVNKAIKKRPLSTTMKGGFLGALLAALAPVGISLATSIIPKVLGLFKRGKGAINLAGGFLGKLIEGAKLLFGKAVMKLASPITKMIFGRGGSLKLAGTGAIALSGGFLSSLIKIISKIAKPLISIGSKIVGKIIPGASKLITPAFDIAEGIQRVKRAKKGKGGKGVKQEKLTRRVAMVLVTKVIPQLMRDINKRSGIKAKKFSKNLKQKILKRSIAILKAQRGGFLGALLSGLASLLPIGIELGKAIIPKIVGLFKRGKGMMGGFMKKIKNIAGKIFASIIGKIGKLFKSGKQMGTGIPGWIKKKLSSLVSGITKLLKSPITKQLAKAGFNVGKATLPMLLKALAKKK